MGAPIALTDASQNLVWQADYDAFGQVTILQDDVGGFQARFPGQYEDPETGLYYNWHRYYIPEEGRYIRPDPLGMVDGPNLYAYALNNPVNYTDPEGLSVYICQRPVDINWLPDFVANNLYHMWVKTDSYESGMGGECPVPGQGCADTPYSQTVTKSHEGQSDADNASCELMQNVDEQCVNDLVKPGQPTGTWSLINQCQSFAYSVVNKCRYGPQVGPVIEPPSASQ